MGEKMRDENKYIKLKDNKVYKSDNLIITSMLPGDLKGSPDESFSKETLVFIDEGFNNNKIYKHENIRIISSLRTVTIFPGDRKVAGCFYFLGGLF